MKIFMNNKKLAIAVICESEKDLQYALQALQVASKGLALREQAIFEERVSKDLPCIEEECCVLCGVNKTLHKAHTTAIGDKHPFKQYGRKAKNER